MIGFEYQAPETIDEVFELLERKGEAARIMAGGTALILFMKQRLVRPEVVVSLRRVAELDGVRAQNGTVRIGATVPQRSIEREPIILERFPVLVETLRKVATPRVRNQATLGGNLTHADPNQDPPVTLIALDASVRLRTRGGERIVRLDEFFSDYYETVLQPEEILTDILLPAPPPNSGSSYLKFLPRTADDYATVAASATVVLGDGLCQDVRIVLGSAGPTVIRARKAEMVLRGQPATEEVLRTAAAAVKDEVDPLSDIRGSAEYKRAMTEVFAFRALRSAVERAQSRRSES